MIEGVRGCGNSGDRRNGTRRHGHTPRRRCDSGATDPDGGQSPQGRRAHQVNRITKTHVDRGECLDRDTDTIPANEAKVQLWACSGWTNPNWTFR